MILFSILFSCQYEHIADAEAVPGAIVHVIVDIGLGLLPPHVTR
jgi:hypothetical protein